jgi:hypothetical protein
MKTAVLVVGAFIVLWYLSKLALRLVLARMISSPGYKNGMAEYERKRSAEESSLEVAPWIGITGLDESTQHELPRYLRRELGEFLEDGGLKAADLEYVGKFRQEPGEVHYWRIPHRDDEPTFAYVEVDRDGDVAVLVSRATEFSPVW